MPALTDTTMTLWDFAALRYFGLERATNSPSGLSLCGIPLSMRTCTLLFARIDILMGLFDG